MIEDIKKKEIIQKIENRYLVFNEEQKYLISNNNDLQIELINLINEMYPKFTDKYLNDFLFNKDILNLLNLLDDELIEQASTNFLLYYGYSEINKSFLNITLIKEFLSNYIKDNHQKEKMLDFYFKNLQTKNYETLTIYEVDTLKLLLEFKRYDLIKKATIKFNLYDDDVEDNLIKELKEKDLHLNIAMNILFHEPYLELLSFEALLSFMEYGTISKNVLNQLDKFINGKISVGTFKIDHNFNKIFYKLPNQYEEKINQLIKINVDNIENDELLYEYLSGLDDSIIEYLLENKKINVISCDLKFIKNQKYINRAIQLINKNPEYYKNKELYVADFNLLECCIKNKLSFRLSIYDNHELSQFFVKLLQDENININDCMFFCSFLPSKEFCV